jgi:hypothetical protein
MTLDDLAHEAYAAYATYIEYTQPQGREMPVWGDLGETYRGAWLAAVARVTHLCGVQLDAPQEDV